MEHKLIFVLALGIGGAYCRCEEWATNADSLRLIDKQYAEHIRKPIARTWETDYLRKL